MKIRNLLQQYRYADFSLLYFPFTAVQRNGPCLIEVLRRSTPNPPNTALVSILKTSQNRFSRSVNHGK